MDSELQSKRVRVMGKGLEACIVHRRGKSGWCRSVAPIFVHLELRCLRVALGARIGDEPFHVDGDVLPSKRLQLFGEPVGIGLELLLIDRGPIAVPAVPTHGRSGGEKIAVFFLTGCRTESEEQQTAPTQGAPFTM